MAVDTAQKRRSSLYSLMPFFTPSATIDGTMSQADRIESAWGYTGILAPAVAVADLVVRFREKGSQYGFKDKGSQYEFKDKGEKYKFRHVSR